MPGGYGLVKRVFTVLCLGFFLATLTSCYQTVVIRGDKDALENIDKVAFVEFMFSPPVYMGLSFNHEFHDDVTDIHIDRIGRFYQEMAEQLGSQLGLDVRYGPDLFESEAFKGLEEKGIEIYEPGIKHRLYTKATPPVGGYKLTESYEPPGQGAEHTHFTEITLPDGSHNFLDLSNTRNPHKIFSNRVHIKSFFSKYKNNISMLCKALDVDAVAVGSVTVLSTSPFLQNYGRKNNFIYYLYLNIGIVFFDRNGDIILSGYANSPVQEFTQGLSSSPDIFFVQYQLALNRFDEATSTLVENLK